MSRQLIMLDFDGVLVDSLDVTCDAAIRALDEHGFHHLASREAVLSFVDANWYDGLSQAGVPPDVSCAIDETVSRALDAHAEALRPVPGIRSTIQTLSQHHTVLILTSNYTSVVDGFLRRYNVTGVSGVMCADEETSKIRKIERAVSLYAHSGADWYVGDTVGDIIEARLAGVRSIAVTWGWHSADRLLAASPDYVAQTPSQLVEIVTASRS
jgi:phosphoglycolate phosphatase